MKFLVVACAIVAISIIFFIMKMIKNNRKLDEKQRKREEFRKNRVQGQSAHTNNSFKKEVVNNRSSFTTDKALSENLDNKTKWNVQNISSHSSEQFNSYKKINVAIKGLNYRSNKEIEKAKSLFIGEEVFLKRDFNNEYDKYATAVMTPDNIMIGYVDSNYSHSISIRIREDFDIHCFIAKITDDAVPFIYMDIFYK